MFLRGAGWGFLARVFLKADKMRVERVAVKLVAPWANRRTGTEFPLMDKRTADALVKSGKAVLIVPEGKDDADDITQVSNSEPTSKRTRKPKRSKKNSGDS